jgi:hypothetical protein
MSKIKLLPVNDETSSNGDRTKAPEKFRIANTAPEESFDDMDKIASLICKTSISWRVRNLKNFQLAHFGIVDVFAV